MIHILCPTCSNNIGDVFKFVEICKTAHNRISLEQSKISPQFASYTGAVQPIDYILDAAGLHNMCCRMHVICNTQYQRFEYYNGN
jgi:DNA-directed RNA polymerase subunit N (RpoN/RPB10)